MCQSKNEGGIRCTSTSGRAMAAAVQAYRLSGTEDDYQKVLEAQADFAASNGGMRQVRDAQTQFAADGNAIMVATMQRAIDRGEDIRRRAADLRKALGLRAHDSGEFTHETGGDFSAHLNVSKRGQNGAAALAAAVATARTLTSDTTLEACTYCAGKDVPAVTTRYGVTPLPHQRPTGSGDCVYGTQVDVAMPEMLTRTA